MQQVDNCDEQQLMQSLTRRSLKMSPYHAQGLRACGDDTVNGEVYKKAILCAQFKENPVDFARDVPVLSSGLDLNDAVQRRKISHSGRAGQCCPRCSGPALV